MKIPVYDKNGELEGFVEPISETAADSAKGLGIICGFLLIGAVLVWLFNFAKSVLNLIAHWQALAVPYNWVAGYYSGLITAIKTFSGLERCLQQTRTLVTLLLCGLLRRSTVGGDQAIHSKPAGLTPRRNSPPTYVGGSPLSHLRWASCCSGFLELLDVGTKRRWRACLGQFSWHWSTGCCTGRCSG